MPKKIIIVRHGETDHNAQRILQGHLDVPLNEKGTKQAHDTAALLRSEAIDVFYSSDLIRALETARIAAAHHRKVVFSTPLLRERYFGAFQGKSFDHIASVYGTFRLAHSYSFPPEAKTTHQVELDNEMQQRAEVFMQGVKERHKGQTVAVFSHGGMIRHLLRSCGISDTFLSTTPIKNAEPIVLVKQGDTYGIIET